MYHTYDPTPKDVASELIGFDTLTQQLLYNRGINTALDAESFLKPDYDKDRHDPFLLAGMEAAVSRIQKAIDASEHIVVYSDYDCDGIPGAVVLHDFFSAIGYINVEHYIPHRHYEGFGLSVDAVEKLAKRGAKLIITIDCGTSDVDAVAAANEAGIDVIITDHHEPNEKLPNACAIVNPRIGDTYPFPHLCGAAVVFKLAEALIARGSFEISAGREKWWLDMVGLATIGDMVPLIGENRVFAYYGLTVLRKSRRPGLQQLLRRARASQQHLTEDDIGFTIAPRINAASRMDTPEDAFHMLASTDEAEAGAHVHHLEKLNNERKGLVASITKELKKRIATIETLPDVLVFGSPDWRPSLAGLAANSLAETYDRPTFIWGRDGNEVIKGSCRSGGGISVVTLMNAASNAFIEHGGHHMSGGFSVKEDQIHTLSQQLNDAYRTLGDAARTKEVHMVDMTLTLADVHDAFITTLTQLAPYGVGNAKPLFAFERIVPHSVEQFGKTKEHLKLVFKSEDSEREAIAFFRSAESYGHVPKAGEPCTVLAHVERSFFMGRHQTRLRIVDIVATGGT